MLVVNGIHLLENLRLDELAASRAYEFALMVAAAQDQGWHGVDGGTDRYSVKLTSGPRQDRTAAESLAAMTRFVRHSSTSSAVVAALAVLGRRALRRRR